MNRKSNIQMVKAMIETIVALLLVNNELLNTEYNLLSECLKGKRASRQLRVAVTYSMCIKSEAEVKQIRKQTCQKLILK